MATAEWNTDAPTLRRMSLQDLDDVMVVEHRSFTAPWSRQAFLRELVDNQLPAMWWQSTKARSSVTRVFG